MRICVFGSSSKKTSKFITDSSYDLGEILAERGHICVNGGGQFGVMGALNKGCRHKHGHIVGVIHERFVVDVQVDKEIVELIVTRGDDLNDRKQNLYDNADCFIVMPGGLGTFDEIFDCMGAKSLNMKKLTNKPMVIVNLEGFYDGIEQQLKRAYGENVLYSTVNDYAHFVTNVKDAVDWCEKTVPPLIAMRQHAKGTIVVGNRETSTSSGNSSDNKGTTVTTTETHDSRDHSTTATTTITSVSQSSKGSSKNSNNIATIDTVTVKETVPDDSGCTTCCCTSPTNGEVVTTTGTSTTIAIPSHYMPTTSALSSLSYWWSITTGICIGSALTVVVMKSLNKLK